MKPRVAPRAVMRPPSVRACPQVLPAAGGFLLTSFQACRYARAFMRYKILLADDSLAIQQVVQLAFEGEDVDVVVVDDGAAAIAAVERESPDVVLADASLPGADGYDLAERIRTTPTGTSLPVILLAGAFEPVDHARADTAGCRNILVKPFAPGDLVTQVMTLLDPAYVPPSPEPETGEQEQGVAEPVAAAPQVIESTSPPEPLHVEPQRELVPIQSAPEPQPVDMTAQQTSQPEPVAVASASDRIVWAPEPEPVDVPPSREQTSLAHRPILAQAFATLLAAERELAPRSDVLLTSIARPAAAIPPGVTDAVKRELIRRVRRRLTKAFVRDMAEQVVGRAVDRIVREELARMNVCPPAAE